MSAPAPIASRVPVGPLDGDAGDPLAIHDQVASGRLGQHVDTRARAGIDERRHQLLASAVRRAHHPPHAMPGVEEAVDEAQRHAMRLAQPQHGVRRLLGEAARHLRVGAGPSSC
jgi:hypothetical protein